MVATDRVKEIFADARAMYSQALARLEQGDVRDAAEKAWCATKRATDALVLARDPDGREPRTSGQSRRGLGRLQREDSAVETLRLKYSRQQTYLHGGCFYDGDCEGDTIPDDIRDTISYIEEAERLAQ